MVSRKIDQTTCDVEFSKRFLSYVVDWGLGGIFTGLPAVLTYGAVTGKSDMFSDLYVFQALGFDKSYVAGIGTIYLHCFIIYIFHGKYIQSQTLGKAFDGVSRILKTDGNAVDLKTLILRQFCGLMLLESIALVVSNYLSQLVTLTFMVYVDDVWSVIGSIICSFNDASS